MGHVWTETRMHSPCDQRVNSTWGARGGKRRTVGLGVRTAVLGLPGWQEARKVTAWQRESLVQTSKCCLERGSFLLCWQAGHTFPSLQSPTKGLACWELGESCRACGIYPPQSFKLTWRLPVSISGWPLGVAAFRPRDRSRVQWFCSWQDSHLELEHSRAPRGCLEPKPCSFPRSGQQALQWGACTRGTDDPIGCTME